MSASQIPNLFSLRGAARSRGRGRGGLRDPLNPHSSDNSSARRDAAIQATDTDAAVSRLSAVSTGYLDDAFARYFVNGSGTRRLPIINRGTYSRTTALDSLISSFLFPPNGPTSPSHIKQIVSLGAGTDTRYFRLRSQNRHRNLLYHEFDFPSVCASKRAIIQRHPIFNGSSSEGSELNMKNPDLPQDLEWGWGIPDIENDNWKEGYIVHPLDLRSLASKEGLQSFKFLRQDVSTLIISECCLCYLPPSTCSEILTFFSSLSSLGLVLYEPIGSTSAFGQMMVENLASRGIAMPTVKEYVTLDDQRRRLKEGGFEETEAVSIEDVWENWVGGEEKRRVDGLEGLDEVEEWRLLARHYAVVWGWKGSGFEGWNSGRRGTNS